MRRIAATLAVGALLFSAGSAWADFYDGLAAAQRGDYATALQEWQPLAEQGNAAAQFNLGIMYATGRGVPENDAEAVKWYRKAAEQGNAAAQFNLGIKYDEGTGVPEDYVKAYMWLSLAKAQGQKQAAKGLDLLKTLMTGADISKAQALASEWWEEHND